MKEILIGCVILFVLLQFHSILDLKSSKFLIKFLKAQADLREQEQIIQGEQWEKVIVEMNDVNDQIHTMEDANQLRFEEIMNYLDAIPYPEKASKKRGPYRPRKPKELDHKKTPPEN